MTRWRILASLVVAFTVAGPGHAQTCSLMEPVSPDNYHRIHLNMSLSGTLKLHQDEKDLLLKESASATHQYFERLLEAGPDGTANKAVRLYEDAKVTIIVDGNKMERKLRPDRTFLIALSGSAGVLAFCPSAALTREELDVVDHFDTMAVSGILPGKEIKVGESWKLANTVVQALCHLQGLSEHTMTGKLEHLDDDKATISLSGTAAGIDQGATIKSTIQAKCYFDVKKQFLVSVEWTQKDEREAGPVSPAAILEVTIKMARTLTSTVSELGDLAVVKVPDGQPPRALTNLQFKDAKDRFDLVLDRQWHLVSQSEQHIVWRLMDRGEFVAQVSVAPWQKAEAGKHLEPAEIKEIIANTPGWAQETLIKAEEISLANGQWAYLVAGEGDLDGVRAVQYFYLVAGPNGDQAMATFTMTPPQVQKLGSRDLEFVRGLLLPGGRQDQAVVKSGSGSN